jgi:hypothetical protein
MKFKWVAGLAVLVGASVVACGQTVAVAAPVLPPVATYASSTPWEGGIFFQGGVGLEDRTNYSFVLAGGHLGKVLTPQLGSGIFRGNFEYAVEIIPFWKSFTPKFLHIECPAGATREAQCTGPNQTGGTYDGVSINPIMLRWNFTHGKRIMPWAQAAGGVLYTTRKYPAVGDLNPLDPTQTGFGATTSVFNFTPQGGIGAHYFVQQNQSVDFSVNGVHISNASLANKNPGVNVSLQVSIGYSWWK